MNRNERRAQASYLRSQAKNKPKVLTMVPESEWPDLSAMTKKPVQVWMSDKYLVQVFKEYFSSIVSHDDVVAVDIIRLSVIRASLNTDGNWQDGITWDELQQIKTDVGYGDWYGIEIYPRNKDLVNVANLRHLWLLSEPLDIGWFK